MSSISGDRGAWDDSTRDLMADWSPESSDTDELSSFQSPAPPPRADDSDPQTACSPRQTHADPDSFPTGPTRLYEAFRPGSSASGDHGLASYDFGSSANFEMHDAPTKRKDADRHRKQQADDAAKLPRVGDLIGGFLLKVELGRGALRSGFSGRGGQPGTSPCRPQDLARRG